MAASNNMAAAADVPPIDKLDSACMLCIMRHLGRTDLARAALACRSLADGAGNPLVWLQRLREDYGLHLDPRVRRPRSHLAPHAPMRAAPPHRHPSLPPLPHCPTAGGAPACKQRQGGYWALPALQQQRRGCCGRVAGAPSMPCSPCVCVQDLYRGLCERKVGTSQPSRSSTYAVRFKALYTGVAAPQGARRTWSAMRDCNAAVAQPALARRPPPLPHAGCPSALPAPPRPSHVPTDGGVDEDAYRRFWAVSAVLGVRACAVRLS